QQPLYSPFLHQQAYEAPVIHQHSPVMVPQLDSGLVVPKSIPADDYIQSLNKAMPFLNVILTSINNPHTNNQNEQNQQTQTDTGDVVRGNAIETGVIRNMRNATANQSKVIQCYNYKGEGHIARQCTHPKRAQKSE
ncbi:retrovirus-related pol polyprotein from transposon TNT 1-94, partial [Tanacetum coccineum]